MLPLSRIRGAHSIDKRTPDKQTGVERPSEKKKLSWIKHCVAIVPGCILALGGVPFLPTCPFVVIE
ncbi:MAG: hypothetical protein ACI845_003036 [Gammaproteobacteria bacterium]|jgi:hypothetical protein